MRNYVANNIRLARSNGLKIDYLRVFNDNVMKGTDKSQVIC